MDPGRQSGKKDEDLWACSVKAAPLGNGIGPRGTGISISNVEVRYLKTSGGLT